VATPNNEKMSLLKYYTGFDHESEMNMLNDIIIPDIKDAERVGTGKPSSSHTSEELEAKVH
jgi:hypothetical protein